MDIDRIKEVAEYYRNARHEPGSPSYATFVRATKAQWDGLVRDGWEFSFVYAMTPPTETYRNSDEMFQDMASRWLRIDTHGQEFAYKHPLAAYLPSPYKGLRVRINEAFRAVHDVLGHGATRCLFETFEGELEAIENHKKYYPKAAWPALMGETLGQLCHYWAGYEFVEIQEAIVLPKRYWTAP